MGKENAQHLVGVLRKFYETEKDGTGSLNYGITLDWHYDQGYVNIAMINYVQKQLVKYKQPPPKRPQNCPFQPNPVHYGKE